MDKARKRQEIFDSTLKTISDAVNIEAEDAAVTSVVAQVVALSNRISDVAHHLKAPLGESRLNLKQCEKDLHTLTKKATDENALEENILSELMNEKERLQKNLNDICSKLEEQQTVSDDLLKEAVRVVPKGQHMCSLLRNITKIDWDVATCKGSSAAKGALMTKVGAKMFNFDSDVEKNTSTQDKLWEMMEEGKKFSSYVQSHVPS